MIKIGEDVRITKSKRDLCNALMELMLTTPFEKISVGEICKKAMINRMTFYKHYSDKYDLLNDVLLGIKESIVNRIKNTAPAATIASNALEFTFTLIDAVVDECLERKSLLVAVNNDDFVLTMISTTIEKSVQDLLVEFNQRYKFRYQLDSLAAAITGAASFLIRHWLFHYTEDTKEEFLTNTKEFFRDLFRSKILFA